MRKIFLASLSGILLSFAWPAIGFFPFIFFAFVPLLILEEEAENGRVLFFYSSIAFLIFNILTTYWVWYATPSGSIFAFLVNSLLMSSAFLVFHKIKKATTNRLGYVAFVVCWLAFEYLHLNWDLSWPWLTLGNVFANATDTVQWYEYTGVLGGTLWVLLINVLIFRLAREKTLRATLFPFLLLLLPLLYSYSLIPKTKSKDQLKILIVQPNIDPNADKFSIGYEKQLADFITLSRSKLNKEVDLLVGPETALQEGIWENKVEATYSVRMLRELQQEFPNLNILIGSSTYRMFESGEKKTATARQIRNEDVYYDAYNSAIFIPDSGEVAIYHKTRLVPGAEKTPFPKVLDRLAKVMVDLGGVSGSLGSENRIHQFEINENKLQPLICYESIYGDLKQGKSNLITIITNDGWWKNTAGYKQHFSYASLRAIEQRKTIVRSANTGISGVINERGEVVKKSKWDEAICLSDTVDVNNISTFYSIYGDYIGRLSVFIAFMLLIVAFTKDSLRK